MAAYDLSISEDVSLSRILDSLVEDGESPSVVVSFLKMHEDCLSSIAERSLLIDRVFCSAYLKDCSFQDAMWLLEHLDSISAQQACCCAWQILLDAHINKLDRSPALSSMAKVAASFARAAAVKHGIMHPHSGYGYPEVKQLDYDIVKNGMCPELVLGSLSAEEAARLLKGLSSSLFAGRILQLDVFESCSDLMKHLMLSCCTYAPLPVSSKFLLQILALGDDPAVKFEIVRRDLVPIMPCSAKSGDQTLWHMLAKANSYPEIAIHLQLLGEDAIADSIVALMHLKKWSVLAEMAEMDEDTMQKNFPVKDLIDYIKANTCLAEADKHKQKGKHYAA